MSDDRDIQEELKVSEPFVPSLKERCLMLSIQVNEGSNDYTQIIQTADKFYKYINQK